MAHYPRHAANVPQSSTHSYVPPSYQPPTFTPPTFAPPPTTSGAPSARHRQAPQSPSQPPAVPAYAYSAQHDRKPRSADAPYGAYPAQPQPPRAPSSSELPYHSRLLSLESLDTDSPIRFLLTRRKPSSGGGFFSSLFSAAPNTAEFSCRVKPLDPLPRARRREEPETEYQVEKSPEKADDLIVHVRSPYAGSVAVEFLHRGALVASHSLRVEAGPPDPQRTSVELFASGDLVGEEAAVDLVLFALDAGGNPTLREADTLRAHVFSPGGAVRELRGPDFAAHPPGDYNVTVPLGEELGEYTIVVTLSGVEVRGSPLAVTKAGRHKEAIARALLAGEGTFPVYVPEGGSAAAARGEDERARRARIIASSSGTRTTFAGYDVGEIVGAVEAAAATARGVVNTVAEAAEEIARQAEGRPSAAGRPSAGSAGDATSSRSLAPAAASSRGLAEGIGEWASGVAAALGIAQPRERPLPGEQEADLRVSSKGLSLSSPFLLLGAKVLFEWPLLPGLRIEEGAAGPGWFEVRAPEWPPVPFRCGDAGHGHAAAGLLRRLLSATNAAERVGGLEAKRRLLRVAIAGEGSGPKARGGPFLLDLSDEEEEGRRGARGGPRRSESFLDALFGAPETSRSLRGSRPGELQLRVRRSHVLEDSIQRLHSAARFRRKLRVRFEGEEGVDAGGVTADWFDAVAGALYAEPHRLFLPFERSRLLHPNPVSLLPGRHDAGETYTFVGRFLGLALRETVAGLASRPLALYFSRSFYKMLLGVPVSMADLESDDPETYERRIKYVLETPLAGAGLDDLCFAEELHGPGGKLLEVVELKKGGRRTRVTDRTKHEYCALLAAWLVEGRVAPLVRFVRKGLCEMVDEAALRTLTPNELELLLCGMPKVDPEDMRKNAVVEGCPPKHRVVEWFWRAVKAMSKEDLALLLQFCTGSARLPLGGFSALEPKFTVRLDEEAGPTPASGSRLPRAQTCFHRLLLPHYSSADQLRRCLSTAIRETAGFGFA